MIDFNVNSFYAYPGGEITGLKNISIFSRISENPIKSFEFMYSFFLDLAVELNKTTYLHVEG